MKSKKIAIALAVLSLSLLCACGNNNGSSESKISISNSDVSAEAVTGEGQTLEWPKELKDVIDSPDGKITYVAKDNVGGGYSVAFSEMQLDTAKKFVSDLKAKGYKAAMDTEDIDGLYFLGQDASNNSVTFSYNLTAKEAAFVYMPKGATITDESGDDTTSAHTAADVTGIPADADMTDLMPWVPNFISGVPELNGKIYNTINDGDTYLTVYFDYVKKEDVIEYIKTLKANGYTTDVQETTDIDRIYFSAFNDKGESVEVSYDIVAAQADVYMIKAEG